MTGSLRPYTIPTARCILTEMRVADAAAWLAFMSDPLVIRYLPDRFESLQQMSSVLDWLVLNYDAPLSDATRITLAVHLKAAPGQPIGWVTLGPLPEDERLKEIGYALAPAHWGKGLATEAAAAFLAWVRRCVTDAPLYATVDVRNAASVRVLEKLGMTRARCSHLGALSPADNHGIYTLAPLPGLRDDRPAPSAHPW